MRTKFIEQRYAGWQGEFGRELLTGDLEGAAAHALRRTVDEPPVSGRQERLENWSDRFRGEAGEPARAKRSSRAT